MLKSKFECDFLVGSSHRQKHFGQRSFQIEVRGGFCPEIGIFWAAKYVGKSVPAVALLVQPSVEGAGVGGVFLNPRIDQTGVSVLGREEPCLGGGCKSSVNGYTGRT